MSVCYLVEVLDEVSRKWLGRFRVTPPEGAESRYPTPREVRTVLAGLAGYYTKVTVSQSGWQAFVADAPPPDYRDYAQLIMYDYDGDEDARQRICFEKGDDELNVRILERICRVSGPLLLLADVSPVPLLVLPGADPETLCMDWSRRMARWEAAWERRRAREQQAANSTPRARPRRVPRLPIQQQYEQLPLFAPTDYD